MLFKWYEGERFIWTSMKIGQLVRKTAWWFNTIGFWQWWCFVSIFFINWKAGKKIYLHQKCLTDTCDFNSCLSEILGLIVFCLIMLKTIIFNINCAGRKVCLIFLYSFSSNHFRCLFHKLWVTFQMHCKMHVHCSV
jgi:hypothetical protein